MPGKVAGRVDLTELRPGGLGRERRALGLADGLFARAAGRRKGGFGTVNVAFSREGARATLAQKACPRRSQRGTLTAGKIPA